MAEADPRISKQAALELDLAFAVRMDAMLKVRPFISDEGSRYYLNGAFVQANPNGEGVLIVATDGHRMGIQRSSSGICNQSVIVKLPREVKLPSTKTLKEKGGRYPWLVCMARGSFGHLYVVPAISGKADEDTAEIAVHRLDYADLRIGNVLIDGTFPEWRKVVPVFKEGVIKRSFNPKYLADFGTSFELEGHAQDSPHLVRTTDKDFVGVVMPMRWDRSPTGIPDWLPAIGAAA